MTNRRFTETLFTIVRHLDDDSPPKTRAELAEDTGIHEETIRQCLVNWPEYFEHTNTRVARWYLRDTPELMFLRKQAGLTQKKSKIKEVKKWYTLTPEDMEVIKESTITKLMSNVNDLVFGKFSGQYGGIPEGLDKDDRERRVANLTKVCEALIYKLNEDRSWH